MADPEQLTRKRLTPRERDVYNVSRSHPDWSDFTGRTSCACLARPGRYAAVARSADDLSALSRAVAAGR
jgi:hypothetical protein